MASTTFLVQNVIFFILGILIRFQSHSCFYSIADDFIQISSPVTETVIVLLSAHAL